MSNAYRNTLKANDVLDEVLDSLLEGAKTRTILKRYEHLADLIKGKQDFKDENFDEKDIEEACKLLGCQKPA